MMSIVAGLSFDARVIVAGMSGTLANRTVLARDKLDSPISFTAETCSLYDCPLVTVTSEKFRVGFSCTKKLLSTYNL